MRIASIRTTPVLAPIPRPVRTASGTIDRFPLVLIDVATDNGVHGRAYAQIYLPELLPALERTVAGLAGMITGMALVPRDVHAFLLRRCRLSGVKNLTGAALGGLDMALWDTWARARGQPLACALGAELRPLKAYHSVGNALMVDPDLPGGPPTMFVAGNDPAAKATVAELLEETGWDVADLGGIEASRWLEAMCMAWTTYGFTTGGWGHAFKLLRSS